MTSVSPPMISPDMSYADLAENFAMFDEWDDRYSYLIDLGRKLPVLPHDYKTDAYKVRGCMSQVWMVPGHPSGAPEKFAFAADSDASIVKGLIAVLGILFSGQTPEAIAKIDVDQAFRTLGLDQHISPSRRNGLVSMVEKIKGYAKAA
jgi:cysteine desulfuration protein SufE